jgi:uncharacterized membrane protein YfcA
MQDLPIYIYPILFLIALLYASVGHGGASGYLALMGILGVAQASAKPVALVLNCAVSIIAFVQYYRNGHFSWRIFLILAAASIPMAFAGASFDISELVYKRILGMALFITALRLFIPVNSDSETTQAPTLFLMLIGAAIGFVSGLIGIGGGIILSPILLLSKWSNVKVTAGISALFIFVNSVSGLSALINRGITFSNSMYWMLLVAILGALIGSTLGSQRWNSIRLKQVLSFVLFIAAIKLILI